MNFRRNQANERKLWKLLPVHLLGRANAIAVFGIQFTVLTQWLRLGRQSSKESKGSFVDSLPWTEVFVRSKRKSSETNLLGIPLTPLLPFWFTCAVNVTLRGWLKLVSISTLDCTQLKLLRLKDRHQLQRFALVCSFVLRHHVQKHVSVGLLVHSLQHR